MATTIEQQTALDESLVPSSQRLRIGRSNFRLPSDIQSKETTLQVVYDVLRNSPLFRAFQVTADVPEIYMQEFWAIAKLHHNSIRFKIDTRKSVLDLEAFRKILHISPRIPNQPFADLPTEEEVLDFLRFLGHSQDILTFYEYKQVYNFTWNGAYIAIERYLNARFSHRAKGLRGSVLNGCKSVFLDMDEYEEAVDEFEGTKIWWSSRDGKEPYFKLTFHRKHRDIITTRYLQHVVDEGKAISIQRRQRRLYTNTQKAMWTCVIFDHPSTFNTLAMDPKKKEDILNDLTTFKMSEDYYRKIGKMWKRGYLLYGPPGTGKSSMIAAMANFLKYDVFDLELTSVEDNTALRKLLIHTSTNSLIVIEDIDCSLDLTGQRTKKKDVPVKKVDAEGKKKKGSEVTLSGLLNIIDGLWSVCGNERIIVFTTNHVEKLDPALVRSGRMDMHIELSYCCFETFKVLAKNYLDIESHELFATISQLLEETNMTPADVAGNLMPKSPAENAEVCLNKLIKSLENAKEKSLLKTEKEARKNSKQKGEEVQDE
nr:AAA-ATPase ASD, mitochondrial-like [Tanacetum cinerariifolium]